MSNSNEIPEAIVCVVAHPDDAETMLGFIIANARDAWVIVASDGEASTIDRIGNNFVSRGKRQQESQEGLTRLGVTLERQIYLGLPDGKLDQCTDELQKHILAHLRSLTKPFTVVTLGEDGYDGHSDHKAAHLAAQRAVSQLKNHATLLCLSQNHSGSIVVSGDASLKLEALCCHESQFDPYVTKFYEDMTIYLPLLFHGESYKTVR